jgi:SAM-dependent methyltransferase
MNQTELQQKEYYNNISNDYQSHYGDDFALKYRFSLYANALKGIDISNKYVLDAMCGGGQSSQFFNNFNCKILGVDISENQCNFFTKILPNQEVICSSILDFKVDKKFDIIITDSLHHLHPNVNDVLNTLDSYLKEDGIIIFWEPNKDSIFDFFRRLIYKIDKKYFLDNEESISVRDITNNLRNYRKINLIYGGNLGYLFLNLSMALRIKSEYKRYYFKIVMFIEKIINIVQFKNNSLWFILVLQKK